MVLEAANDEGIDSLENEVINAHCVEAESPDVIFQFTFSPMPHESLDPDLEKLSKKRKRAPQSDFKLEEPMSRDFFQNIRLEVFLNEGSDTRSYAHRPRHDTEWPDCGQPAWDSLNEQCIFIGYLFSMALFG